jgi:hypothetical protein
MRVLCFFSLCAAYLELIIVVPLLPACLVVSNGVGDVGLELVQLLLLLRLDLLVQRLTDTGTQRGSAVRSFI